MGYLIIQNFNKHKVTLKESYSYYNIGYKLDYINISSIPFTSYFTDTLDLKLPRYDCSA